MSVSEHNACPRSTMGLHYSSYANNSVYRFNTFSCFQNFKWFVFSPIFGICAQYYVYLTSLFCLFLFLFWLFRMDSLNDIWKKWYTPQLIAAYLGSHLVVTINRAIFDRFRFNILLLKPNCTWMFIGWSSTNFTFFVPIWYRNKKRKVCRGPSNKHSCTIWLY
jgi:hypothetical protein